MNFSTQAMTYAFLLIPLFFACVVIVQGITKIQREDSGGKLISALGVIFLLLIAGTYFFFIR